MKDYLGSEYVGQHNVRNRINFYIDCQRRNGYLAPLFLHARRGDGKTTLARIIGRNLATIGGRRKPFVEVNGGHLKTVKIFVDKVVEPHLCDSFSTLFIDEIHAANDEVLDFLLSVVQPSANNMSVVRYLDKKFEFDYSKFSFMSASTNAEMLGAALKNRLTRIDLEDYSPEDLVTILTRTVQNITFKDDTEHDVISVCRGSPRLVVKLAKDDISQWCAKHGSMTFNRADWNGLSITIGVKPLGLTTYEIEEMRLLHSRGPQSLTCLAATMGLDSTTVRKDIESFLLAQGLIEIDGKRKITTKGIKLLSEIK